MCHHHLHNNEMFCDVLVPLCLVGESLHQGILKIYREEWYKYIGWLFRANYGRPFGNLIAPVVHEWLTKNKICLLETQQLVVGLKFSSHIQNQLTTVVV